MSLLFLSQAGATTLAEQPAPAEPRVESPAIKIVRPAFGEALIGEIEIEIDIRPATRVREVEILLDGRRVALLTTLPYLTIVDVGGALVEHRLDVVVELTDGSKIERQLLTPALRVDEAVDLELQQVYVTASRTFGGPARGLGRNDFVLLDNGVEQQLVTFEGGDAPITTMAVIDGSSSMRGEPLKSAILGVVVLAEGLREHDEARLVIAADRVLEASDWTRDPEVFSDMASRIEADGGTSFVDPLFVSLNLLEQRQGRRVLILLSDGYDSQSVLKASHLLRAIRQRRAIFYWFRLREPGRGKPLSAWTSNATLRRGVDALERATKVSGGRVFDIDASSEVEGAFTELLRELRDQVVLGFYPSDRAGEGSWHRIEVDVERFGVRTRTADGYFDR